MKKISIVIPAYREEKNVPLITAELKRILKTISDKYNYEIIFINDWSPDHTWQVIQQELEKDKNIKWITLSRNFWHQAALTSGLSKATWDIIVSMDCDMQDPPALILDMIEKYEQGADVVYARRLGRNDNFLKKQTALLYYKLLAKMADTNIPRNVWDFRLVTKQVLDEFLKLQERDRYIRWMFAWLGYKVDYVDFVRPERIHWTTGYTWKKMIKLGLDWVLNFSMAPLKLWLYLWSIMIILSIIFFIYFIVDIIIQRVSSFDQLIALYPLYKWLIVFMFGFMGLQFIFLWIIGEYIGRIYNETRARPNFVIKETQNFE